MSLMMPVFSRGQMGTVTHKMIGADQLDYYRSKGWYDAPEKVPFNPGQTAEPEAPQPVYNAGVKPYGAYGSVHGEAADPAPKWHDNRGKFAPGNPGRKGKR